MKLEHLAAYLPYRLKMITGRHYNDKTKKHEHITSEMRGVSESHINFKLLGGSFSFYTGNPKVQPTPILCPFSALEKGFYKTEKSFDVFWGFLSSWVIEKIEYIIRNNVTGNELTEIIEEFPYSEIKVLLKEKIDIFGLIPTGEAIDINTI